MFSITAAGLTRGGLLGGAAATITTAGTGLGATGMTGTGTDGTGTAGTGEILGTTAGTGAATGTTLITTLFITDIDRTVTLITAEQIPTSALITATGAVQFTTPQATAQVTAVQILPAPE